MEYQPGVCNIGPAQQRRRLLLGVGSLLLAVVTVAVILAMGWPRWTLIASLLFPLYGAAMMGYFQYRERFCVGFAGIVFDVGDGTNRVQDEAALEADRRRAVRLNTKSLAVGAVGSLVIYGVSLVVL